MYVWKKMAIEEWGNGIMIAGKLGSCCQIILYCLCLWEEWLMVLSFRGVSALIYYYDYYDDCYLTLTDWDNHRCKEFE